jgi:hypothetical protein
MLNVNINYPYPVIREYIEDYKNTIFTGKLTVQLESEGYVIHPSFDIENNEIRELIEKNFLTYAVEVQCVSTWFRRLYRVDNNQEIHLNSMEIHERVEITPCIIANRDIPEFVNDDFEEEYQGMSFEINIGDIIGIGSRRTFDALYQNDIIKNGTSIVSIARSDVKKEITSDFTGNIIQITLPKDQYSDYMDCGYNKIKYKLLNAILIIPVLVEAIGIIANDERDSDETSGFETKSWYKTIVVNLKRYAESDENKYKQLLDKPFSSAELLLGNNSASALKFLSQID